MLEAINYSLSARISSTWKTVKVIPLIKDKSRGYTLDNIRPISLTSNFVKLIERVLHARMTKYVTENEILSPCQIGFRPGMSILCAHVDSESGIKLARRKNQFAAVVTLDISKANNSLEYPILIERMKDVVDDGVLTRQGVLLCTKWDFNG